MQQYSNRPPFMGPEYHYDLRALIFGIVSFLFCQLPVLSVVTGIVALSMQQGRKSGSGITAAACVAAVSFWESSALSYVYFSAFTGAFRSCGQ